jgi:hypothetical protein
MRKPVDARTLRPVAQAERSLSPHHEIRMRCIEAAIALGTHGEPRAIILRAQEFERYIYSTEAKNAAA